MNRRSFFKLTGAVTAMAGLNLASAITVAPSKPEAAKPQTKAWWKEHFRAETFESVSIITESDLENYRKMQEQIEKDGSVFRQMHAPMHTDTQIDKLPDKAGAYKIFRIRENRAVRKSPNDIPTITIELTSTPILLVV